MDDRRSYLRECLALHLALTPEETQELSDATGLQFEHIVDLFTAGAWYQDGINRRVWLRYAVALVGSEDEREIAMLENIVGLVQDMALIIAAYYGDFGNLLPRLRYGHNFWRADYLREPFRRLLATPEGRARCMAAFENYCEMCEDFTQEYTRNMFADPPDIDNPATQSYSDCVAYFDQWLVDHDRGDVVVFERSKDGLTGYLTYRRGTDDPPSWINALIGYSVVKERHED